MKRISIVFVMVLVTAGMSLAADFSQDTSGGISNGQDNSLSEKGSREKKDSKTKSHGKEKTRSKSDKNEARRGADGSLDTSVSARALFLEDLAHYKLPEDFGLAAKPGSRVNLTMQELLQTQAKSNAKVSSVTAEGPIRTYIQDIAKFGAILGQAQVYLKEDIGKIGKLQTNKSGETEVRGLGADDVKVLAAGALRRAKLKISDARIQETLDTILHDQTTCRFAGDPSQISCGQVSLSISAPPNLKYQGVDWYGTAYAGISGTYKVASTWSWSKAAENAIGSSTFVRDTADQLEAEGKSVEAVLTRKQSVERSKANKTNMSPGKFLPQL